MIYHTPSHDHVLRHAHAEKERTDNEIVLSVSRPSPLRRLLDLLLVGLNANSLH
jgi:hypothetical protein